ncbi:nucleotidyltransferase domain-containing protein [Paenibacillus thalictri]|uniref:DUF4111 domain-containing protein n=1 Tax=Paenibacillus thalictri TaxID=2527873 RepID=A0A4Q9DNA0_9BACL|nr:nucleotidyltransferase domain-containing protein [Paenibacillus thalictri]TBL75757.1 DUF4111 domain-containing protein [Paenibacillus thalictri]
MLPEIVGKTMSALCGCLEARLPGVVESVYVYGSAALGAYIEGSSDIDFIAVTGRSLSSWEVEAVADVHREMERLFPDADIMGAYIVSEQVGKQPEKNDPVLTYFNKTLHIDGTGADLNPITWWVLKRHGICVYGRKASFAYEISAGELAKYVIGNMNSYWAGWIDRLQQPDVSDVLQSSATAKRLDQAVEWCVLGMLRQYYTINEGDVTSKIGAGTYGLAKLPEKWHPLIREAVSIKLQKPEREYESQLLRHKDLVDLLQEIVTASNEQYKAKYIT